MSDDRTLISSRGSAVSIGTELNQTYKIDALLGVGGMGEVFKGHNIQTGDPVAIKIVLPEFARDDMILELFRKEARILNHLSHDAIVRYYVFSIDSLIARPYLAMEFVDGKSLAEFVKKQPLAAEDFMPLLRRLADGLHRAHEAGVIHRDMSPDNVILPGGLVHNAKIIDFGIARSANVGGGTLLGGSFAGKYNYVSPEQLGLFGGEVTLKSDIYSLALVMAAAMRGYPIDMSGSQVEVIEKRRVVPELKDIPKQFLPVLTAMLQPDPAKRPASMAEVRDWPDPAVTRQPKPRKTADPEPERPPPAKGQRVSPPAAAPSNAMRNVVIAIGALAVMGIGALGGWIVVRGNTPAVDVPLADNPATAGGAESGSGDQTGAATADDAPKSGSEVTGGGSTPSTAGNTAESGDPAQPDTGGPTAAESDGGTDPTNTAEQSTGVAATEATQPPPPRTPEPEPGANSGTDTSSEGTAPLEQGTQTSLAIAPEALAKFVRDFGAGTCIHATPLSLTSGTGEVRALATAETARDLKDAFTVKAGFAPTLSIDPVSPSQCDFVSSIRHMSSPGAAPLAIDMARSEIRGNNADTGAVGDPLNITVSGAGDRNVYLFVMDHNGDVQNINRLCPSCIRLRPSGVTAGLSLFTPAAVDGEPPPPFYPMLVFAVASPRPLISVNERDAFASDDFIAPFLDEVKKVADVSTAVAFVKLKSQ